MAVSARRWRRVPGDGSVCQATSELRTERQQLPGDGRKLGMVITMKVKGHGDGRKHLTTKQKFGDGSAMVRRWFDDGSATQKYGSGKRRTGGKRLCLGSTIAAETVKGNRIGVGRGIKSNQIGGNGRGVIKSNQIKKQLPRSREGLFSLPHLTSRCRVSCGLLLPREDFRRMPRLVSASKIGGASVPVSWDFSGSRGASGRSRSGGSSAVLSSASAQEARVNLLPLKKQTRG
ncbi:hypothetical protein GGX14DRAFT_595471 [Mycena pura]|uniref:Uncharacterized protein n=1 Tax=Mycena pura TaxID=153505 RepID=A0AAD6YGI3_9AGAR|nr:hypothetical protein GGX14DRAFT_595471 [Mycena pura]